MKTQSDKGSVTVSITGSCVWRGGFHRKASQVADFIRQRLYGKDGRVAGVKATGFGATDKQD